MISSSVRALESSSGPISKHLRELLDRIFNALWPDTSQLVYVTDHVITISYEASKESSSHLPRWPVTSKLFPATGLAQFHGQAVVTCVRSTLQIPSPAHAHIGHDILLMQTAKGIRPDVAVRCRGKQVSSETSCHAYCELVPTESTGSCLLQRHRHHDNSHSKSLGFICFVSLLTLYSRSALMATQHLNKPRSLTGRLSCTYDSPSCLG